MSVTLQGRIADWPFPVLCPEPPPPQSSAQQAPADESPAQQPLSRYYHHTDLAQTMQDFQDEAAKATADGTHVAAARAGSRDAAADTQPAERRDSQGNADRIPDKACRSRLSEDSSRRGRCNSADRVTQQDDSAARHKRHKAHSPSATRHRSATPRRERDRPLDSSRGGRGNDRSRALVEEAPHDKPLHARRTSDPSTHRDYRDKQRDSKGAQSAAGNKEGHDTGRHGKNAADTPRRGLIISCRSEPIFSSTLVLKLCFPWRDHTQSLWLLRSPCPWLTCNHLSRVWMLQPA